MIARVGVTRHDRVNALSYDVLAWRTTPYGIIAREVRVRIAVTVSDRPRCNVRSQAPTERNIQRELGSHVSVGHGDRSHTSACIAAQLQIACLH